ncbi:MAG: hypothetical protein ACXADA_17585 [Candidatus Hodarchaeales archaeon]
MKLLGRDYPELGKYKHFRTSLEGFFMETIITAGMKFDPKKKVHFNEDAALLIPPVEGESIPGLLAVADAHWGREAAEISINTLHDVFYSLEWSGNEPVMEIESRLWSLIGEALDTIVRARVESETALVAGFLLVDAFHWVSFGDCFIYAFPPDKQAYTVNETLDTWLGQRVATNYREFVIFGSLYLKKGATLLLTTDGLPEAVYGRPTISVFDMRTIIETNTDNPIVALTEAALDAGGEDNLAAILVRFES